MSVPEFKTFNFFKLETIDNAKYKSIKSTVTAHCGNSSYKIFCNNRGVVYVFLADWECISFQATANQITACAITEDSDILAIIEQSSGECLMKCYSVIKLLDRKSVSPLCSAPLQNHCKVATLKVCSITDSQAWISVGLETGSVLLYKSSFSRSVSTGFKTLQVGSSPIRGIEFIRRDLGDIKLFVSSDVGVSYFNLSADYCTETKQVVDDEVGPVSCCTLKPLDESFNEQYFVVGREGALYCYTSEGRGPCFAIQGVKEHIKWFGKHLLIVLKSNDPTLVAKQYADPKYKLIIINVDNSMIVFNEGLSEVECIFPALDSNNCFIFMKDGEIFTLRDQGIGYKLQLLYDKNLYDIALKLVEELNVHPSVLANVYVRYADYLLQRGDVAASVKMFIRTIGYISPFRVISRLLNIRYNEYIVQYLRVLIDTGHGCPECRDLHQSCCRRLDLPSAINQVFNKLTYNYHFNNFSTDQTQSTDILSTLMDVKGESTSMDDVNIASRCEHWVVSNWPLNAAEILKNGLVDKSLESLSSKEKFIQIFLSLLFPNKDCLLDVISSIYADHKPNSSVNLVWAEILMQMWKSHALDSNFVLEFFRNQKLQINEDVHIICHTHKFWPGVKMVHNGNDVDTMPLTHGCDICPMYRCDINSSDSNFSHQMLMQTLRKEYRNSNHSSTVFQQVVSNIFHHNPHNMLTVIQKVATNPPFNVAHLNNVLSKEVIMKRIALQPFDDIPELERKLLQIKALLEGYSKRPIEFRNSSCDACKQSLKQPAVFFSCQHAYHKECILSYSESNSCTICKTSAIKRGVDLFTADSEKIVKKTTVGTKMSTFRHISEKLTLSLYRGSNAGASRFKTIGAKSYATDVGGMKTKLAIKSTNPFDDNCEDEAGYNPFL